MTGRSLPGASDSLLTNQTQSMRVLAADGPSPVFVLVGFVFSVVGDGPGKSAWTQSGKDLKSPTSE